MNLKLAGMALILPLIYLFGRMFLVYFVQKYFPSCDSSEIEAFNKATLRDFSIVASIIFIGLLLALAGKV